MGLSPLKLRSCLCVPTDSARVNCTVGQPGGVTARELFSGGKITHLVTGSVLSWDTGEKQKNWVFPDTEKNLFPTPKARCLRCFLKNQYIRKTNVHQQKTMLLHSDYNGTIKRFCVATFIKNEVTARESSLSFQNCRNPHTWCDPLGSLKGHVVYLSTSASRVQDEDRHSERGDLCSRHFEVFLLNIQHKQ